MAGPVPLLILRQPLPKPTQVTGLSELAPILASLLSGSLDVSLIRGEVDTTEPTSDKGPWLPEGNDLNWYFWFNHTFGYQPSEQGCPVGTIAIAGDASDIPKRWLLCNGSSQNTTVYQRLFNAIGYRWGGSGSNFNLPPGGVFFINSLGLGIDPRVPSGGSQTALIPGSALPALRIEVPYLLPNIIENSAGPQVPNLQSGLSGFNYEYPVTDENGNPVGGNQQPIPIMPPFALANFMIRYL